MVTGSDADVAARRAPLAPYVRRPGWTELAAVRGSQVFAVEHGLCRALFDDCPTCVIAPALHPQAFADPAAELRRHHEQFQPVTLEGAWMTRLT